MFLRTVIFVAAAAAIAATQVPAVVETYRRSANQVPVAFQSEENAKPRQVSAPPASLTPGSATLAADRRGHFKGAFRFNGRSVEGMVDTGASLIAINESTARKLGFGVSSLDFRHTVGTANGNTEAARIVFDRVEIGNVRIRDVEAYVLRDKALSDTLVGMSFLKKLKSFQIEAGNLKLVQ
jgi:aspartyl protease family protein